MPYRGRALLRVAENAGAALDKVHGRVPTEAFPRRDRIDSVGACRQRYRRHLQKNPTHLPAVAWRLTVAAFAAEVRGLLPHTAVVRHNVFDVGPDKRELLDARLQRPAHRDDSA